MDYDTCVVKGEGKRMTEKRIILFFVSLMIMSANAMGNRESEGREIQETLSANGFTESYIFPTSESLIPSFFIDRFTFIENGGGSIHTKNIISGEQKVIVDVDSWNERYIHLLSLNDKILYFSVIGKNIYELYAYDISAQMIDKQYECEINNVSSAAGPDSFNDYPYSWFDDENDTLYIINSESSTCIAYTVETEHEREFPLLENMQVVLPYGEPAKLFYLDYMKGNESYVIYDIQNECISSGADFSAGINPFTSFVSISDDVFYVVLKTKLFESEIYKIDVNDNSLTPVLQSFPYQISGIWKLPDGGYCFMTGGSKKGCHVFCYID